MKTLFISLHFGGFLADASISTPLILLLSIIVVLLAVMVYFLSRKNLSKDSASPATSQKEPVLAAKPATGDLQEEIAAAIALGIHMFKSEIHDEESFTITLKKVSKIYSPWSSKIYTLRQNPR